jgi:predicted nuclease of predicted toxin-antitoxin system
VRLIIDMNLSPEWADFLRDRGWDAEHWSNIGDGRALDETILATALQQRATVLTQDLDFPRIMALTKAAGPSVVILRITDELDTATRRRVAAALDSTRDELANGALLVIDEKRSRIRLLPLLP